MPRMSLTSTLEWVRFTVIIGCRVYRTMLLTLAAIAMIAIPLGWQAYVVKSGSMEPHIAVGDVALGRPYEADDKVVVGRVYMIDDPSVSGERILVHRIVERRNDGDYVTRGDANTHPDTTPITPADIDARAILLVPYIGLPIVWVHAGQWAKLAIWLALTIAAFLLATRNVDGEPPRWTLRRLILDGLRGRRTAATHGDQPRTPVHKRGSAPLIALLAACVLGATTFGTANATFTSRTQNNLNTWTAGAYQLPYVKAVMTDQPRGFWLLDETTGTNVRDYSRTYPDGTTSGNVQRGLPGAHTARNPGTSFRFNDGKGLLTPNSMSMGNNHSVELWFRTTSTQEGYLIGFEQQGGSLLNYDRTVLMNAQGRIVVGDWSLFGRDLVTSPASYNDGRWHHLVVTSTRTGNSDPTATIYVDGVQVARGQTTGFLTSFNGNWQIGEGRRAAGTILWPFPVTLDFRGDLDAVAVYDRVLTAAQVRAHFDAR